MRRLTIGVPACTETMGLLILMAWADGRLDDREKAGIRGAAQVLNLSKEYRDRLEQMLERAPTLEELDLRKLTTRERAFAFVASAWMAQVDQVVDPEEEDTLERIRAALEFSKEQRDQFVTIARNLEPLPDGVASWSEQITTLFKAIPPQLEEPGESFEVVFE